MLNAEGDVGFAVGSICVIAYALEDGQLRTIPDNWGIEDDLKLRAGRGNTAEGGCATIDFRRQDPH